MTIRNGQKLGATGEYPDGKINSRDEGELAVALSIDRRSKRVLLEFGKEIAWIGMTPDEARGFGELLIKKADELK